MQPGVDIWYMTENMAAQFFQKITLNASAGGHKSCARTSYQKRQRKSALRKLNNVEELRQQHVVRVELSLLFIISCII